VPDVILRGETAPKQYGDIQGWPVHETWRKILSLRTW